MRRTAFHPSTVCWERDGQRRVSEIQTWSKHLLHVCLCLKGEGKVFWGTPQNLEGTPSMVALIDKYPDPKRLLRHPHLLHQIQSVRCFEAMIKSRKIQKKSPYFSNTKSWNQWKWLKCAWSAPYIRIRIDGYVWDISGWGLIQSDPFFMPTKSRLKCLVGQLVTILGATCPRSVFKGTTSVEFAKLANNFAFKTCFFSTKKISIDLPYIVIKHIKHTLLKLARNSFCNNPYQIFQRPFLWEVLNLNLENSAPWPIGSTNAGWRDHAWLANPKQHHSWVDHFEFMILCCTSHAND